MNCVFLDCNRITIGDNCGIAPSAYLYCISSGKSDGTLSENSAYWNSLTAPVTLGNNVWIGGGSIILPGVTIGDNTTIGAGSVVTSKIFRLIVLQWGILVA